MDLLVIVWSHSHIQPDLIQKSQHIKNINNFITPVLGLNVLAVAGAGSFFFSNFKNKYQHFRLIIQIINRICIFFLITKYNIAYLEGSNLLSCLILSDFQMQSIDYHYV